MKYLTVQQYRLADMGINLDHITDFALARLIEIAESDIDAFMAFDPLIGGFEPHTFWYEQRMEEDTLKTLSPSLVPLRQVLRYRIQVSNLTSSGAGFFAQINPTDCALNVTEKYVEIVPLQSITYSLAPVLIQWGLRPPIVQLDCEVGYYLSKLNERLFPLPGYAQSGLWAAMNGFWASTYTQSLATQPNTLPPVPPVIRVDGVVQTANYTIDYTEGQVTFSPPLTGAHDVRADFTYQVPNNVRDAAIEQVTSLLGKRRLDQLGMTGLALSRNGDVEIRTLESFPARFPTDTGALCDAAAKKLASYVDIPVG